MAQPAPQEGDLSWRLSAHPVTLLCFLAFRSSSLLLYLLSTFLLSDKFILVFILTILLLATDFYYLKNIAGRRLVGLRWWNEVDTKSGDSHWVFESRDSQEGGQADNGHNGGYIQNKTDSRFFWLALYAQPALWIALAVLALVRLKWIWLSVVVIALILTITNTVAFSRCDKFSHASNLASRALNTGGFASKIAGGMFTRMFNR